MSATFPDLARRPGLPAPTTARARLSAAVLDGLGLSLEVYDDLASALPLWGEIDAPAVASAFQSPAWLTAWTRSAPADDAERPLIVAGRSSSGRLLFILPLALTSTMGTTVLRFLGQPHANYNLGLYDAQFIAGVRPWEMRAALAALSRLRPFAAVHFAEQPRRWNGFDNPLASLSPQRAANESYQLALAPDFDAWYDTQFSSRTRATMRRKARRLEEAGPVMFARVTDATERLQSIEAFLAAKSPQLREQGLGDPFSDPRVGAFYRALVTPDSGAGLDVVALRAGRRVVAIELVLNGDGRAYLLNSVVTDESFAECSPGALLLKHDIETASRQGHVAFDFGPGKGAHKSAWKPGTVELCASVFAMNPAGLPAVALLSAANLAKRTIKSSPVLWSAARSLRRRLKGRLPDQAG